MLTPKKKISKKEIKQDALLTAYADATSLYYNNKKYINYALTALVVVIIAVVIYVNNRNANNEKATAELAKVFGIYDAASNDIRQYTVAIQGQPEQGIMGLQSIVDNYGSTEAGQTARFYLANAYFNLGQFDNALKNYEDVSSNSTLIQASAVAGAGACYEARKEYDKAAVQFEKAASLGSATAHEAEYLFMAGKCYGLAGDKTKALTLLKQVKKEYPASTFAREVDRYISQFSV